MYVCVYLKMDRPKYHKRRVRNICDCVTVGAEHLNDDHRNYRCCVCMKYGWYTTKKCVGCNKYLSDLHIFEDCEIICWECDNMRLLLSLEV